MTWISWAWLRLIFRPTDTDGVLNSVTPTNYNLIQKPRSTGLGGGVGFLCRKSFSPSIVSSPVFKSFEIIILSFRSEYNSFVAACVYRPPGSCTTQFLEDFGKMVSYRRYHRIDINQFRKDLRNIPFVLSPAGTATELYDQYRADVTQVLDKYTPIISRMAKRQSDEWLSESYRMARSLRRQFERMWRKHKTLSNRSRLRKQIAWCNRLANKDKGSYYANLITANSEDPKKLWQSLKKVLHRTSETVLPAHSSEKNLADTFASFFVSSQSWLSELLLSNLRHTSISTNWIIHISQPISQGILLKQLYCL